MTRVCERTGCPETHTILGEKAEPTAPPFPVQSTKSLNTQMPQRSSSPGSFKRHGDREVVDRYRSRRDAADSYNRDADHETRDSYRGTVDRRRDYRDNYDDHYRRRDDDRRRRRDEYDGDDDGGRRRDDHRSRRGGEDRPARDRRDRDGERGGSARRSASPRRSRPRSHSTSGSAPPPVEDKAKPNFAPSGLLAAATNTVKNADGTSTLLKYNEPPEARKPLVGWRLYVFKGEEQLGAFSIFILSFDVFFILLFNAELLHIHRQSAYLIGRDRTVADIPLEHPSCSKQHAVIQCA